MKKWVLHLVGSPESQFFYELSLIYARNAFQMREFPPIYLVAFPDGEWALGDDLAGELDRKSLATVFAELQGREISFAVPHLFCDSGLSTVRSLIENFLKIPLLGSSGRTGQISGSKLLTCTLAKAAGVRTAGTRVYAEQTQISSFPVIIKPDQADNSEGVSLVRKAEELGDALALAEQCGGFTLVEDFIPGRELRAAVIERGGKLVLLPVIEYLVSGERPLRLPEDKLDFTSSGLPEGQVRQAKVRNCCPADLSQDLEKQLKEACVRMHRILGCRHFSLFDFRVHEESGELYFLEAGLFWSFTPQSMISKMIAAGGEDVREVVTELWKEWTS